MNAQHTPTPFDLPLSYNGSETTTANWIEDANGKRIATMKECPRDSDRANYIVRACNSHEALVAALKTTTDLLDSFHEQCNHAVNICFCDLRNAVADSRGALAQAEE